MSTTSMTAMTTTIATDVPRFPHDKPSLLGQNLSQGLSNASIVTTGATTGVMTSVKIEVCWHHCPIPTAGMPRHLTSPSLSNLLDICHQPNSNSQPAGPSL